MTSHRYIVIQEWMKDLGLTPSELIAFAIVWDGLSKGWTFKSTTKFAADFRIVIPDYIWTAALRMREEAEGK